MKLNLEFYKQDMVYKNMKNEDKIIEYINQNEGENYSHIIKEDSSEEVLTTLSDIRKNIVYAYDFKPDSTILEVGAHFGEITGALCEKGSRVVSVEFNKKSGEVIAKRHFDKPNLEVIIGKLNEIEWKEKFDYIVLCGIVEYAQKLYDSKTPVLDLIEEVKKVLKEEGKLLIATDNKFAMKSYIGDMDECTLITFDSITGYKSSKKTYKLGKKELEKTLEMAGFDYYKFLYPLPDYKLASLVFSDEYLPSSSKINGYFPYYQDESSIFYSEVDAYDTIIKEKKEMFPFFANSFFVEASRQEVENDTQYISFNNYRKPEYQLMTKIRKDVVEKTAIGKQAKEHFSNMVKNIEELKNENIKILDEVQEEKTVSKFVKTKLASQMISDNRESPEEILKILHLYKETIEKNAINYIEGMNTVFETYLPQVDKTMLEQFHYLKNGYWDMILKNCFIIENECVFFDQEWKEENVPVEFLIYRSIVNIEKIRNKIEEYRLYEKMGIKDYISIFEQLDRAIAEKIIDKEVYGFYQKKHKNPIYDNYELEKENEILQKEKAELKQEIEQLTAKLNDIYQSKSWQTAQKIERIKNKFKG